MIHYYLQKGITHDKIASLNIIEKAFYMASMELEIERLNKMYSES